MKTMGTILFVGILLCGLCLGGCGDDGCRYAGERYASGESFESEDGCNVCECKDGKVTCTLMACK